MRKTFKDQLKPTPTQERELGRELGRVFGLCRWLYHTAREHRITAWQRVRVTVSRFPQEAEDIRAAFPEFPEFPEYAAMPASAAIHSHVVQDALARLDKTSQAFFRRLQAGEKAGEKAGLPR